MKFKQSMSCSQHKIGNFAILPTRQEYKLVKEDWADEKLLKYFSGNETYEDYKIFEDESLQGDFGHNFEGLF